MKLFTELGDCSAEQLSGGGRPYGKGKGKNYIPCPPPSDDPVITPDDPIIIDDPVFIPDDDFVVVPF